MGIISSKDTRRISFDNKFALNSALTLQKSIQDDNVKGYDNSLVMKTTDELCKRRRKEEIIEPKDDNEIDYWSSRIEHLKQEHQIINEVIETKYDKKIESINKMYEPSKITEEKIQRIKPCLEWQAKTMRCYEENPYQPLRCSAIVQAFKHSVTSCRIED